MLVFTVFIEKTVNIWKATAHNKHYSKAQKFDRVAPLVCLKLYYSSQRLLKFTY